MDATNGTRQSCYKTHFSFLESANIETWQRSLTKPFHKHLLLCNLNSYSEVPHRILGPEQLQAEKEPPCLSSASVCFTGTVTRLTRPAVWNILPSMQSGHLTGSIGVKITVTTFRGAITPFYVCNLKTEKIHRPSTYKNANLIVSVVHFSHIFWAETALLHMSRNWKHNVP